MKNVILCVVLGVVTSSAHFSSQGIGWGGLEWVRYPIGGRNGGEFDGGGRGGPKPLPACQPAPCPESKDKCKLSAQENKKIVLDFYNQVFVKRNFSAVDIYYDPNIIQHNPYIGDGKKPFLDFITTSKPVPAQIFRPVAECDLVYLHVKTEDENNKPQAIVDIFRVECGKIVEHWDVIQDVITNAGNPRPMF
ncbi:unnamed protein product [Allacma fusca]|uniref:SnoaL-like domain-containing protein n=1 Tax=Allacma fusca TaxID=39272 RepID=A0A8J2K0K3_9HEXA|nr:unnamed protein product [Allacma fusca]